MPFDTAQLPPLFVILHSGGEALGVASLDASQFVTDSLQEFKPQWIFLQPTFEHEATDKVSGGL